MRIKLSIVTALFSLLFFQQNVWATLQIQTTVSDNTVFLGDLFTLTITINDNDSNLQLDTRPLEKEFNVFRPSQSRSSSYINGKSSQQTQWLVTLQAKRIGDLTIPALKVGSLTTDTIKISVKKPSAQATQTADNLIFMENSLNKKSVYPEQALIFTSKIYIAQNSNSRELELLAPDLVAAAVTVYGEDKKGETIRNGIRYQTITRQFKINASKAGSFTINSPLLTGKMQKRVKINEWQERLISDPINIRGASLQVEIKTKPANYQGEWLVSEDVRLFEKPAFNQQSYHVGEPITRTVTLQVASIDKDKLPGIPFNYQKNLRFYPDQDELTESQTNGLLYAQRTSRHAIIADHAGELTLPEIRLAWWNSETDTQEYAVLPAQTLTILAAAKKPEKAIPNVSAPAATASKEKPATADTNDTLIIWQIICALLLLMLVILTLYHLSYRRAQRANKRDGKNTFQPSNQAYLTLQENLKTEDAALIYQALLNFAQSEFPALKSLSQLSGFIHLNETDKELLVSEIQALEKSCAIRSVNWNSSLLSKLIKKHLQQKTTAPNKNIMNLNPS